MFVLVSLKQKALVTMFSQNQNTRPRFHESKLQTERKKK